MNKVFLDLIKTRRSIYQIANSSPISDEDIIEIVNEAVKHSPTAFNSQSSRVVILLGTHHEKLWDITTETLRKLSLLKLLVQLNKKCSNLKTAMVQYSF